MFGPFECCALHNYIIKHNYKDTRRTTNLPDIFKHVEHLRGEVGVGHIKLCEVRLQHWGRRLLGLQGGHLLLKAQDPVQKWDGKTVGWGEVRKWKPETELVTTEVVWLVRASFLMYFLAMLSIFCFFFRRGREEEDVPTREEVDWETCWETIQLIWARRRSMDCWHTGFKLFKWHYCYITY